MTRLARRVRACRFAEQENDFDRLAGRQFDLGAQSRAGIEPRSDCLGERCGAGERGRVGERAVSADEFAPIASPAGLSAAQIGEGDARSEARIPAVAGEHRAGGGVDFGRNKRQGRGTRRAENPFDIGCNAEPTRPARAIGQHEARNLDRIVDRHVLQQIRCNLMRDMFEAGVSAAVAGDISRGRVANRQRRRSPEVACVIVSQVERFAGRSLTGSFDHGVIWFSRLLTDQV